MICYKVPGLVVWKINESVEELHSKYSHLVGIEKNHQHYMQTLAAFYMASELFDDYILHLESGKPYLANTPDVAISITNTKDYVALSYSANGRSGVDMEYITRNASRVTPRISSQKEIEMAKAAYPKNGELLLWCLKEASYKMVVNQPEGIALQQQNLISINHLDQTAIMQTKEGQFSFKYFELDEILLIVVNIQ